MIDGIVRIVIILVTLGVAFLATGEVMAAAWQDAPLRGYAGALGVELVLAYAIFKIAKASQKGIFGIMILVFGAVSIAAQILHSWAFSRPLDPAIVAAMPVEITWVWRYLLPAMPTLAGMAVGLLDVADKTGFDESAFVSQVKRRLSELTPHTPLGEKVLAVKTDEVSDPKNPSPPTRQ